MTTLELDEGNWNKQLTKFTEERSTLKKLLYRNANQHRSTISFRHLQALHRNFKYFTPSNLQLLRDSLLESGQLSGCIKQSRLSSQQFHRLLTIGKLFTLFLEASTKAIHYIHKSAVCLSQQLAKRVFGPLNTVLLMVTAAIFESLRSLIVDQLEPALTVLRSDLDLLRRLSSSSSNSGGSSGLPVLSIGCQRLLLKLKISSTSNIPALDNDNNSAMDIIEEDEDEGGVVVLVESAAAAAAAVEANHDHDHDHDHKGDSEDDIDFPLPISSFYTLHSCDIGDQVSSSSSKPNDSKKKRKQSALSSDQLQPKKKKGGDAIDDIFAAF